MSRDGLLDNLKRSCICSLSAVEIDRVLAGAESPIQAVIAVRCDLDFDVSPLDFYALLARITDAEAEE